MDGTEVFKPVMLAPVCVWAGSAFNFILQVLNNKEVIFRACRLSVILVLIRLLPRFRRLTPT